MDDPRLIPEDPEPETPTPPEPPTPEPKPEPTLEYYFSRTGTTLDQWHNLTPGMIRDKLEALGVTDPADLETGVELIFAVTNRYF